MQTLTFKQWVKRREHPFAKLCYLIARGHMPCFTWLHRPLYRAHIAMCTLWHELWRRCYFTPLFLSRLRAPCDNLYLYGGMPYITGALEISVGDGCRISGKTTLSARPSTPHPQLIIGRNCDIGWQNTLAIGTRIVLGDNVRLAGNVFLAGYPGHPLNATARAQGEPCQEEQIGDIILEDDVWLATGVSVMAGVRIGRGSIIAAGSVVTRDIPPGVMAAGVPARVVKELGHG